MKANILFSGEGTNGMKGGYQMAEYELVVNYDKCTGCRICEIACSMHNIGLGVNPQRSKIRIVKLEEEADTISIPVKCMQCEKPICEAICPTGAIFSNPATGARLVDTAKCTGCSACVYACPFGVAVLDRSVGAACICDLCDGAPLCARMCPFEALQYVRSDEVNIRLRRARIDKLLDFLKPSSAP